LATLANEEEVIPLLSDFHKASPYGGLEFNEVGVREAFRKAVQAEKESSVVILARNEQNSPTGLLAALKSNVPFLTGSIGLEWCWYTKPQGRNAKTGLLLLDAFEFWCQSVAKVEHIQVSSLQTLQPLLLDKLYQRRGYRKTESAYIRTLS
jgi:hypothetical protein